METPPPNEPLNPDETPAFGDETPSDARVGDRPFANADDYTEPTELSIPASDATEHTPEAPAAIEGVEATEPATEATKKQIMERIKACAGADTYNTAEELALTRLTGGHMVTVYADEGRGEKITIAYYPEDDHDAGSEPVRIADIALDEYTNATSDATSRTKYEINRYGDVLGIEKFTMFYDVKAVVDRILDTLADPAVSVEDYTRDIAAEIRAVMSGAEVAQERDRKAGVTSVTETEAADLLAVLRSAR